MRLGQARCNSCGERGRMPIKNFFKDCDIELLIDWSFIWSDTTLGEMYWWALHDYWVKFCKDEIKYEDLIFLSMSKLKFHRGNVR